MPTPVFQGKINNQKLGIKNSQLFYMWLGTLEGKDVDIIVRKQKKKRTNRQNSYYWVVMTFIASELGYTPEEMHATFKAMFLKENKKGIEIVKSTTKLSTLEFTEYLDKVICKVAEIDIQVPTPEDYYTAISFVN
jgi:hypothetical protein